MATRYRHLMRISSRRKATRRELALLDDDVQSCCYLTAAMPPRQYLVQLVQLNKFIFILIIKLHLCIYFVHMSFKFQCIFDRLTLLLTVDLMCLI